MRLKGFLAGIAAFAVALGAAVAATKLYSRYQSPPAPPDVVVGHPPVAPPAPVVAASDAPAPDAAATNQVAHTVKLITLDFAAGESHTTLALERDPARRAPEKLWVRTYFFTADAPPTSSTADLSKTKKYWSADAVEVSHPFAAGNRPTVTVNAPCVWCGDAGAPRSGFYARVRVAETKEGTLLREGEMDFDISTATPVVVEGARRGK